jgi:hypothetical protein
MSHIENLSKGAKFHLSSVNLPQEQKEELNSILEFMQNREEIRKEFKKGVHSKKYIELIDKVDSILKKYIEEIKDLQS